MALIDVEELAFFLQTKASESSQVSMVSVSFMFDHVALLIRDFVRKEKANKEVMGEQYQPFSKRVFMAVKV